MTAFPNFERMNLNTFHFQKLNLYKKRWKTYCPSIKKRSPFNELLYKLLNKLKRNSHSNLCSPMSIFLIEMIVGYSIPEIWEDVSILACSLNINNWTLFFKFMRPSLISHLINEYVQKKGKCLFIFRNAINK